MSVCIDPTYAKLVADSGTAIVTTKVHLLPPPPEPEVSVTIVSMSPEKELELLRDKFAALNDMLVTAKQRGIGSIPIRLLEMTLHAEFNLHSGNL